MTTNEDQEFEEEVNKIDEKERKGLQKLKKMFSKSVQDTRSKVLFTRMLTNMARATRYSLDAEKLYWNAREGKPKTDADWNKAQHTLEDGIKLIDQAMIDFPSTAGAFLTIKDKMRVQLKDIEYQRQGINKPIEEIQKELGITVQKT